MIKLFLFVSLIASIALAQLPIRNQPGDSGGGPVSGNPPIEIPLGKKKPVKPARLKAPALVLLDARPYFEFTLNHFEKSHPIRWQDYCQSEEGFKGVLDPDVNAMVRKIRVLGISPSTEVVVIGKGSSGHGEEGRVAWMLNYLGVKQVKVSSYENFDAADLGIASKVGTMRRNNSPERPEVEATPWTVKPNERIRIRKAVLEKMLKSPGAKDTSLVDVRSKEEFDAGHIDGAKWVPWVAFVGAKGNPAAPEKVRKVLVENHIDPNSDIIFYSNDGVESGYATFATIQLGVNVRNFDGGFDEWKVNQLERQKVTP